MKVVKMRVLALARKVQTNEQFRERPVKLGADQSEPVGNAGGANSRPADITMEDSMPSSSRVSADIRQYRPSTASETPPRRNAQAETDVLRQKIQELEAEKANLLAEVERLGREICALKADNEKLKADSCERPNVGLAAELQDILNLISDRDVDNQLLDMDDPTPPAEAGDLIHLAGHKRGSGEERGESSHGTVKRLKHGDVV